MVHEEVMTKIYEGLLEVPKKLHIPDIAAIRRKSDFSQKPKKGTWITDDGAETFDYTLSPCTTHPGFIFRFRAYVMTLCFCTIATPSFLLFEKAIDLVDFVTTSGLP